MVAMCARLFLIMCLFLIFIIYKLSFFTFRWLMLAVWIYIFSYHLVLFCFFNFFLQFVSSAFTCRWLIVILGHTAKISSTLCCDCGSCSVWDVLASEPLFGFLWWVCIFVYWKVCIFVHWKVWILFICKSIFVHEIYTW